MLQLRTLAELDLRRDDGTELLSVVSQTKRIGLLCYLALARPRGFHRRDTLLPMFWPEADDEHARASLRQAVHYLRRSLGEHVVLSRGDEEVGLAAGEVVCDAVGFEEALDAGDAERALGLYQGELLPGLYMGGAPEFERWLEAERARLRERAVRGAWGLAEARERMGDAAGAAQWARRALGLAPTDERLLRACMELLDRAGEAGAAGEAYEGYARRMRENYEVEPSAELQGLAKQIRGKRSAPRPQAAGPTAAAARSPGGGAAGVPASAGAASPAVVVPPGVPLVAQPAAPPAPGRTWPVRRRVLIALAGVLVATAIGGSTLRYRRAHGAAAAAAETASIAVLPFADLSPGHDQAYIADGITAELIELLGQIPGIRVPGPTSSFHFKGKSLPLKDIARQLGVAHVLEGEVLKTGRHVRVTVRFASAAGDRQLWTQSYETPDGDVSDIQHRIARHLASRLRVSAADFPARAPHNPEAYDLYLQGLFVARAGSLDPQTGSFQGEKAIALFRKALAVDPGFAAAWAGLARSSFQAGDITGAEQAARRALALDSTLPLARMALASSLGYGRWKWAEAERELDRAVGLGPSVAVLYVARGNLRFVLGREEEAFLDLAHAEVLDPLGAPAGRANQLVRAGRWVEVLQVMERIPGANPRSRILPYAALGRHQDALALALATGDSTSVAVLTGDHQQVMALVHRKDAKESYCAAGWILRLHWFDQRQALQHPASRRVPTAPAQLQETRREFGDHQYRCLERKVRRHDRWVGFYLRSAVTGDSLGSQPRFKGLLREVGLPN